MFTLFYFLPFFNDFFYIIFMIIKHLSELYSQKLYLKKFFTKLKNLMVIFMRFQ